MSAAGLQTALKHQGLKRLRVAKVSSCPTVPQVSRGFSPSLSSVLLSLKRLERASLSSFADSKPCNPPARTRPRARSPARGLDWPGRPWRPTSLICGCAGGRCCRAWSPTRSTTWSSTRPSPSSPPSPRRPAERTHAHTRARTQTHTHVPRRPTKPAAQRRGPRAARQQRAALPRCRQTRCGGLG